MNALFLHDYPLSVEPGSTLRPLVQKKTWKDSLPIDMLLSAVSVLVVAQSSSEIPEGLMNNLIECLRFDSIYCGAPLTRQESQIPFHCNTKLGLTIVRIMLSSLVRRL